MIKIGLICFVSIYCFYFFKNLVFVLSRDFISHIIFSCVVIVPLFSCSMGIFVHRIPGIVNAFYLTVYLVNK